MDRSTESWILILIIGGVVSLFGLVGFICCYFKEKFRPLYELDDGLEHSFLKVPMRSKSHSSSGSLSSEDSAASFRRTLFQIFIGSTDKPERVKAAENPWSTKFRWTKKSKVKKIPVQSSSSVVDMMPTMTEEDGQNPTISSYQRDRTTL